MSIITYPQINKLATSQWSFFKDYSGVDTQKMTDLIRINNNSIRISFTLTGTIPLNYQVIVRSYNSDGTKVVTDKIILDKKWSYGDLREVSLDTFTDTNTIAVIFKNLDTSITTYGFGSFNVSDSDNTTNKELEYRANNQKNILYRATNAQSYGNTVFLSEVVKINSDKFWLSIKEYTAYTSFKIEILTAYNGLTNHQVVRVIFDGTKRSGVTTPIYVPIIPESKEFRVRITNTTEGATTLDLKTVDIIEVSNFETELQVNSIIPFAKTSQYIDIDSTIELKTQTIEQNKYLHFENTSEFASLYLILGGYKKKLKPLEKLVFRNLNKITSFNYQTDCATSVLKFIGAEEKIIDSEKGLKTDLNFRNLRGYNVIRPYPLAKNMVWGTKTNDNELWTFKLDNDGNIISETLLQTFEMPIIDIFITYDDVMLISVGVFYPETSSANNFKLFRSERRNWGVEVTEITIPAKASWFPRLGIDQVGTGAIIFGEYSTVESTLSVWRSTDQGLTWSAVITKSVPSDIRHFHTVNVDYNNMNDVYVTCGDAGTQLKWFKSIDKGATFTELTTNLGNVGKILGMDITPTHFICVTDAPGFMNQIVKIDKNDFTYKVKLQTSQVFFGLIRNGRALMAYTLTQHGSNILNKYDYVNEMYYSLDDGDTWQTAWRWIVKSASGNFGFRYSTNPDRDGNIYLRTDRAGLEGHFLNQNSIKISLSK